MTGAPGSGKSHKAASLRDEATALNLTCEIHSTDAYFMDRGVYRFDPLKLHQNHGKNAHAAEIAMVNGVDVVIVDNTNVTRRDYAAYLAAAEAHGYTAKFARSDAPWRDNPVECHKRCTHGVPLDKIVHMLARAKVDAVTKAMIGWIEHAAV